MRRAGRITAQARELAGKLVRPGVTTLEIDTAVRKFIEGQGARPSFLNYNGFPRLRLHLGERRGHPRDSGSPEAP